jgi:hypothetical protein
MEKVAPAGEGSTMHPETKYGCVVGHRNQPTVERHGCTELTMAKKYQKQHGMRFDTTDIDGTGEVLEGLVAAS